MEDEYGYNSYPDYRHNGQRDDDGFDRYGFDRYSSDRYGFDRYANDQVLII